MRRGKAAVKRLADDNEHFLRYALGSLAECDTQLIIAESLGYGEYTKQLKATIMSLTMGIRAHGLCFDILWRER